MGGKSKLTTGPEAFVCTKRGTRKKSLFCGVQEPRQWTPEGGRSVKALKDLALVARGGRASKGIIWHVEKNKEKASSEVHYQGEVSDLVERTGRTKGFEMYRATWSKGGEDIGREGFGGYEGRPCLMTCYRPNQ